jgi:hypothetical protein
MEAISADLVNILSVLVWNVICRDPYRAYVFSHFFSSNTIVYNVLNSVGLECAPNLLILIL